MVDLLLYLLFFALLAVAAFAGYWMMGGSVGVKLPVTSFFGPRPEKRLAVVEHANVDGKRRLLLIRRDDVEHLIMTGGPVDVVIETGIGEDRAHERTTRVEAADGEGKGAPAFSRQPRGIVPAQPVNEKNGLGIEQ